MKWHDWQVVMVVAFMIVYGAIFSIAIGMSIVRYLTTREFSVTVTGAKVISAVPRVADPGFADAWARGNFPSEEDI